MAHNIFNKDLIEMLALFLLQKEDLYAYNIMKSIQQLSGDTLSIQGGSLYPILYKLLEKGYLTDRVEMIGKRQRTSRVYYHLTPLGKEYLQSLMDEHFLVERGIQSIFASGKGGDAQ